MNNEIVTCSLPLQTQHRNPAAAELSNRMAKASRETYNDAWRLMGPVTFNVNLAATHDQEKIGKVIGALSEDKEFILFSDYDNYTIFIPKLRMAVQYSQGKEVAQDVTDDDHNWISRVKAAMITYDNFFITPKQIDAQPTEVLQLREEDSR